MRIAILSNSYPPHARGGSGQIAKLQADWLSAQGNDVCVWVPAPFSAEPKNQQVKTFKPQTSIPFSALAKSNPLSRLVFHIEDIGPNAELVEDIRSFKPNVLLTHNLTGCGWGTADILRKTGIRWVHILHDVQMAEPSGQILSQETFPKLRLLWRKYWSKKRSKAFGTPDVVVSPSGWLLSFHKQFNLFQNSQTVVIPNPLPAENSEPSTAGTNTPGSDSGLQRTILYVGRVSKDKGVDMLIQAWKELKSLFESESSPFDLQLKIIGTGAYLNDIKNLNDPTILCMGALEHAELAKHYASASLFVFPSLLMENQPTVLLEAMSAGVNIVASDVGGVGETLGGYGALVPPGNPSQLARGIYQELTKNPTRQIKAEILARHEIHQVMQNYQNLFNPPIT